MLVLVNHFTPNVDFLPCRTKIKKIKSDVVDQSSFADILLSSWEHDHDQYLRDDSLQLGAHAIQYGLLGLWQQIQLDRISCGLESVPAQIEKTDILAANALNLIQEILSTGSAQERTVQDDVRLLGLIALCISRSEQLPGDLMENLTLHRESIDIFALALLHSRSFSTATLLSEVAPQLSETSRVFESLNVYISILSDPTTHRAHLIAETPPFIITPWPQITALFESLIGIAGHLHDYSFNEARAQCEQLLSTFPSCPEVRSLYALSNYFAADASESIAINGSSSPDPLLLCCSEDFSFTSFDRLIYLSAFEDSCVHQICSPKDLPKLGLDNRFYELRSQLQIQLTHNKQNSFDLQELASTHTDQLLRTSGYDPFKLALHSAQLKKIDPSVFESFTTESQPLLPCDLTFVVGLPSPHWSQLKSLLRSVDKYAVHDSTALLEKLCASCSDLVSQGYPASLDQLTAEQISMIRLSYLQNLAICFGGQDKDKLIDFLPLSFEHIGLLALAFPEANFLAIHPPVRESIVSSYLEVNGFSSSHATATLSELTAYCYDYAEILECWSTILKTRLKLLNFSSASISSEMIALKEVFNLIDENFTPLNPYGSFEVVELFDAYEFLSNDIQEFAEDIETVDKILVKLARK